MRPKGSADVLEHRRRHALPLLKRRLSLSDIDRTLGCAASSVMRWRNAVRERGPGGLKVRPTPGRPTKLTAGQQRRLVTVLLKGAMVVLPDSRSTQSLSF
jgi:transposase